MKRVVLFGSETHVELTARKFNVECRTQIIACLNSFGLEALSSESTNVARGVITQFIISRHNKRGETDTGLVVFEKIITDLKIQHWPEDLDIDWLLDDPEDDE